MEVFLIMVGALTMVFMVPLTLGLSILVVAKLATIFFPEGDW